jgi:hypothetical protein
MTAAQGAKVWNEQIRPYGLKGHTLISPAVTSAPSGITWMDDFFHGCGGAYDGQNNCGVRLILIRNL